MTFPTDQAIQHALGIAMSYMSTCGITRVVDITRMDIVGIPVYSAIRPSSLTLAVNSGKGVSKDQAKLSALMEAIEYSFAERLPQERAHFASPRCVREVHGVSILDFCPELGLHLDSDQEIGWVFAERLGKVGKLPVPMESVFLPCPAPYGSGFLKATSSGMACGLTLEQATLHGICEVIERHLNSFDLVAPISRPVPLQFLRGKAGDLADRIAQAGLCVRVRARTALGLNYADAVIWSATEPDLSYVNGGIACHSEFQVAAAAALLEAVQSRLTMIHGGRDDLDDRVCWKASHSFEQRAQVVESIVQPYAKGESVSEQDLDGVIRLEHSTGRIIEALRNAGFSDVLRYRFTDDSEAIQVVRIVIPGAEHFSRSTRKLGKRLLDYIRATSPTANAST